MPKCLVTNLGILNQQLVLVAVTISGILSSSALLPLQLNDIYADDSETNTEQDLTQENIGSGESIKNNCAQNSIDGIVTLDCIGGDTPTHLFHLIVSSQSQLEPLPFVQSFRLVLLFFVIVRSLVRSLLILILRLTVFIV